MRRLLRLYPRWWWERYGEEFTDLVADLAGERRRPWLALDVVRGALDAHLHGKPGVDRGFADAALRRGLYDGLIISGALAIAALLTNVVFPAGPDESDSDPEFLIGLLLGSGLLAVLLVVIGARARRRSTTTMAGAKGGATAGVVIAGLVTVTFLVINNSFLGIVGQQHDKRVAFAASGWSSMRAYLTVSQLEAAVFLLPVAAVLGATLGLLGQMIARPRPSISS